MNVSGFENIISIETFEYYVRVDGHEHCDFSCYVKEEDINSLMLLVNSEVLFDNDDFKFSGYVKEITYSKDISGCLAEVKTIGNTCLFHQNKKKRIFQNKEKTLSDILSFMESMSDIKYQDNNETIKHIIYQDDETDWEFLCRLCKCMGMHIFVGKDVFIGKHGFGNSEKIVEEECVNYKYTLSVEGSFLNCQLKKNLYLGDKIDIFEKHFFVIEKRYKLVKAEYRYIYILKEITEEKIIREEKKEKVYLEAKVINNNDPERKGRLQVNFETEKIEDCMKNSPIWINRLDLYATKERGTIFVPNVDDKVYVHICDGAAYVIGCIREESYFEHYQDCNSKYLVLDDNLYFEYQDGIVRFVNQDNKIEITKDAINISVGETTRLISEKDELCVAATNVNIKGKSGVNIN